MTSRSLSITCIATIITFGLVGCTPSSPSNENQFRTTPASSNKPLPLTKQNTPTAVIQSIQPQPSGLLIKLDKKATLTVKQIVRSPHFGTSKFSFTLHNVQVGNPSIAKLNETVGNQLIQSLEVQKHGTDLIVSMIVDRTINKIKLGTSGSYLGIALQYEPNKPKPPHPVGSIPSWFFKDILTAASVQGTPVGADTYGGMLPFQFSDKAYMLKAPFNGSQETLGFSAYFGSLSLYENYFNMLDANSNSNENLYSQVKYGYIREKENGHWYGLKAIIVNMQNGWQLGFAKNQVIVENNHAGALTYTVYPVQGIELGAPLRQ